MNCILAFHSWEFFSVKDDGAEYDTANATAFDHDWVDSIIYEYSMEYTKAISQSTAF